MHSIIISQKPMETTWTSIYTIACGNTWQRRGGRTRTRRLVLTSSTNTRNRSWTSAFHPIPATGCIWAPLARGRSYGNQDTTARAEPPAIARGARDRHFTMSSHPFHLSSFSSSLNLISISPPTLNNNMTSSKPVHPLVFLHFWHHPLHYWQHNPPLSTPLTPSSPHSLHFWHNLTHTLCTTDTTFSPHLHQVSPYCGCPSCLHWLLTDDDAVHRNVSSTVIVRSKSFPPVFLLPAHLAHDCLKARNLE